MKQKAYTLLLCRGFTLYKNIAAAVVVDHYATFQDPKVRGASTPGPYKAQCLNVL